MEKEFVEKRKYNGYAGPKRCDHFVIEFIGYQGFKLTEFKEGARPRIHELMVQSIQQMVPAPDNIYPGTDEIHAQWFFPIPIFIDSEDELSDFAENIFEFAKTNKVLLFRKPGASFFEEELSDSDRRDYEFMESLGARMIMD